MPNLEPYRSALEHLEDHQRWLRHQATWIAPRKNGRRCASCFDEVEANPEAQSKDKARSTRAHIEARLRRTRELGLTLPIDALAAQEGLTAFDREVLLNSAAVALDPTLEDLFEHFPSCMLTVLSVLQLAELDLADQVAERARFRADAPLRRLDLIQLDMGRRAASADDLLRASINITTYGLSSVLGDDRLSDEVVELSSIGAPLASFERLVLREEDRARLLPLIDDRQGWLAARATWGLDRVIPYGRGTYLLFSGPPGTGKTMTAHAIADRLGLRVLSVDLPTLARHVDHQRLLPGLFREARLRDALLFFDECESVFMSRSRGNDLMPILLAELERFDGVAVLATNLPEHLDEALHRRILLHLRFSAPEADQREEIWRAHLPPELPLAEDVDLERLASRFPLTGGEIKNAVLTASARAFASRGLHGPIRVADLASAARDARTGIAPEGTLRSSITLDDLFVPTDARLEIEEVLHLARWADTWGIGGKATSATALLLHGPPGTGKTHGARAIAGELGRGALLVSAASVRSKWVGESERRLSELFAQADREDAVLVLDEVDAIAGLRGSSRSAHHDDVLTSALLTLLDSHEGLVVMTTNRQDALDPALTRRLLWTIHLPMPDREAREALWQAMLPQDRRAPGVDLRRLAALYPLSGADIRAIVLRAAAHGVPVHHDRLEGLAVTWRHDAARATA
ncbi:MAG: AAA family ATPase [Deltaproteobacteria bacterium]|nr:MAG: AAA family ATPase [Deltaproteobacteria bacterium]